MRTRHGSARHLCGTLALMLVATALCPAAVHHPRNAKVRMKPYQNETLRVKLMLPEGWKIRPTGNAAAFYSPYGDPATRAALGILKSSQPKLRIEKACRDEFKAEGKPAAWEETVTTIDHQRAIRVTTPMKTNPSMQRLDYYVEGPLGVYFIQCVAPHEKWPHYAPVFASIISSLRFLP